MDDLFVSISFNISSYLAKFKQVIQRSCYVAFHLRKKVTSNLFCDGLKRD